MEQNVQTPVGSPQGALQCPPKPIKKVKPRVGEGNLQPQGLDFGQAQGNNGNNANNANNNNNNPVIGDVACEGLIVELMVAPMPLREPVVATPSSGPGAVFAYVAVGIAVIIGFVVKKWAKRD